MGWLADTILALHAAFVLFVAGLAIYVWVGAGFAWPGVRNRGLRLAHIAAIWFVCIETLAGIACPLTVWEDRLRGTASDGGFVATWLHRLLFYDWPPWVFAVAYLGFALLVTLTYFLVPPAHENLHKPPAP